MAPLMLLVGLLSAVAAANGSANWGNWMIWSSCSVTCGQGKMVRVRDCNGPDVCTGSVSEEKHCQIDVCPDEAGVWSQWRQWSVCSHTCGGGVQTRERSCSDPAPGGGGQACDGSVKEQKPCNENECPLTPLPAAETCITFDYRDSWQAENQFKATNWVWLQNLGVLAKTESKCPCNKCGYFAVGTNVKIPRFNAMDFFKLSVSLWFRRAIAGHHIVILSSTKDQCQDSSFIIESINHNHLKVTVTTHPNTKNTIVVKTPGQFVAYVHVVVTFSASTVTGHGQLTVYVNGVPKKQKSTSGKIAPLVGEIVLGSTNCPSQYPNNFKGWMDSVSFAKHELSAAQVKALYDSHGSCIGEPLNACDGNP